MYGNCIFSIFRFVYLRLYKVSSCTCNIQFSIYKDLSLSSWYQSRFSDFFFLLLSRSRHYSQRVAYFSDEHHRLLFFSYLRKPKTEVTGHSEVDLVETIIPVCSRSPEKLPRVVTRLLKSARCPTSHHAPPAPKLVKSTRALHAPSICR